jgi:hypothetical protein
MAVRHYQVSVTTSAAAIGATDTYDVRERDGGGRTIIVQNTGSVTVYLGASGVTTTTYGHKLVADGVLQLFLTDDDALYVIAASSTTISVMTTAS